MSDTKHFVRHEDAKSKMHRGGNPCRGLFAGEGGLHIGCRFAGDHKGGVFIYNTDKRGREKTKQT